MISYDNRVAKMADVMLLAENKGANTVNVLKVYWSQMFILVTSLVNKASGLYEITKHGKTKRFFTTHNKLLEQ